MTSKHILKCDINITLIALYQNQTVKLEVPESFCGLVYKVCNIFLTNKGIRKKLLW